MGLDCQTRQSQTPSLPPYPLPPSLPPSRSHRHNITELSQQISQIASRTEDPEKGQRLVEHLTDQMQAEQAELQKLNVTRSALLYSNHLACVCVCVEA